MGQEEDLKCQICGEICKRGVKVTCCGAFGCRACCVKAVTRDKKCWKCGTALTSKDLVNDDELRAKVDKYVAQKKAEAEKPEMAELPMPVPTNQKKTEAEKPGLPIPVPTSTNKNDTKKSETQPAFVIKKPETPPSVVANKPDTTPSTVINKKDTPPLAVLNKKDTPPTAVTKKTDAPPTTVTKKTDAPVPASANKSKTPLETAVNKTNTPTKAAETKSNASLELPPPVSGNKNSLTSSDQNKKGSLSVNNKPNASNNEKESKTEIEPPNKKQKVPLIPDKENTNGKVTVTLEMMKQRNQEFDKNLNEVERASNELRYGALLELMFTFSNVNAKCRMCGEEIKSDFMVLKHIQMKHKDIYQNFKAVLGAPNLNQLNLFLHKAIKAEFLYAQKGEFPVPVDA